ncbi:MAG: hsp70 family protein [Pseudomonadales bacterium]|nr:hsp70 family protein [Pseudomonadales bacterium]
MNTVIREGNKKARYCVGIDLGTTHCVVTYCDLSPLQEDASNTNLTHDLPSLKPELQLFEIEQLVGPGEIALRSNLPSFRYHPAKGEIAPADCILPWDASTDALEFIAGEVTPKAIIGEWARDLNSKVDGRGVVSAKSWLSHSSVDRQAGILPWSSAEGVEKVSPVVASASYLDHIRCAWNHRFPDYPLGQQEIVITIPASFDEAARALTIESAKLAGLANHLLLEEPQAVMYDWLFRHQSDAAEILKESKLILVCDLGGGTTDLSLMSVAVNENSVELKRVAVGDHLMLGGDNVDLALAHQAEKQITREGKKLTASALSQLIQQSRKAKEMLLAKDAPEYATITVLGSGSKLIGGTRKTQVSKPDIHRMVLDGFFPVIDFNDFPKQRQSAVVELGLTYVSDPAVSKHIASFLHRHEDACRSIQVSSAAGAVIPDTVLFNGGMFKSPLIVERVLSLFNHWSPEPLKQLDNDKTDQAVAYGAVAYALARRGLQTKIGGGSARSFFLVVESEDSDNIALCVLPKGTSEGESINLIGKQFSLKLGKPVSFNLVSTVIDKSYFPGQVITVDDDDFVALPPLVTVLKSEGNDENEAMVEIVANVTAVGSLQVQCVATKGGGVWDLEFLLRSPVVPLDDRPGTAEFPSNFTDALARLNEVYGKSEKKSDKKVIKNLRPQLEKLLGKRANWDTNLLRALSKEISTGAKRRRRSSHHERLWNNLMGYCLRPGFGYPLDDWKVNELWAYYPQGVQFSGESQSWAEWWTLWRRVAGGLSEEAQEKIYKDIAKFINPGTARNQKVAQDLKIRSYEDIVRLAAVLEHLPSDSKEELGDWLVTRLKKAKEPEATWWALGRVGSRVPFYGSAHRVVPKLVAGQWISFLLLQDWSKNKGAALAASMIARQSGDRERDLNDELRAKVVAKLTGSKCSSSWVNMVEEIIQLDEKDQQRVFGESLPEGLRLVN